MSLMTARLWAGRGMARWSEASAGNAGARAGKAKGLAARDAVPGSGAGNFPSAATGVQLRSEHLPNGFSSGGASICGRRDRPIRKKIMGHSIFVSWKRFHTGNVLLNRLGMLPLLHQPARQHGRRVFFHPKIEKRANFLAEIGGMAEPREFVALQGVSRSGKKKLPRWLCLAVVHKGLLGSNARKLTLR